MQCGSMSSPVSTDFAWLPEDVADAFCSLALHQDSTRPYGSFHEVQLGFNEHYQALLHIEGLYYLGETRSVDEFNIFSQMPAERLCLGCGVHSDEPLTFQCLCLAATRGVQMSNPRRGRRFNYEGGKSPTIATESPTREANPLRCMPNPLCTGQIHYDACQIPYVLGKSTTIPAKS